MNFPLNLSFKMIALSPRAKVTDASGNVVPVLLERRRG